MTHTYVLCCFPFRNVQFTLSALILLFPHPLNPSSSPATAREVRDEGRGRSFLGGVCGDEDESFGQVPEAGCRPPCPLLQPTSKRFPVCQGKTSQEWEDDDYLTDKFCFKLLLRLQLLRELNSETQRGHLSLLLSNTCMQCPCSCFRGQGLDTFTTFNPTWTA